MPTGSRPLPPPHTIRLAVNGTFGPTSMTNVFWIRNGGTTVPTVANLTSAMGTAAYGWAGELDAHQHEDAAWSDWDALYYTSSGPVLGASGSLTNVGSETSDPLPASVAACISWTVQQHFRGGHPRSYVGGLPRSVVEDPKTFTSGFCNALATSANSMISVVDGISVTDLDDLHLGYVSFVNANAWRSPPIFRDFTAGASRVDRRIDSMRRRLGPDI